MKILIACEESQRVCTAFRERGHEAYSCDIIDCSGGHPEWHIKQDVIPLLNGRCEFKTCDSEIHTVPDRWDMIIAHPPCTKTSNAGARHLYKGGRLNMRRLYEGFCGKALFLTILNADCEKIVVENPVPSKIFDFPKYSQTIQPYEYDELNEHPYSKKTCLWIKGNVPLLVPTTPNRRPSATWCPSGSYSHKHSDKHKGMFTKDRARNRSKTFSGIAKAMAEQWG